MPTGIKKSNSGSFKKGEHRSPNTEFKKGQNLGSKHWNWKGGFSLNENEYERNRLTNKKEKIAGRKKPEQCEICGSIGNMCFDHNHETGKFRGWICMRCNLVLGLIKDNKELLNVIIKYL